MDTVLAIDRLTVKRGGRVVVDELTAAVKAGEVVGVVGPNGCGKSTLLAAVAGVLAPSDGRVAIDGASVWGSSRDRTRARTQLGYVPEGADAPGFLLASELWALCATTRGVPLPDEALRDALGLDELSGLALERMSLGQRRRACLGAAFMGPPKLLVLDEPDNGLDVKRLDALIALLAGRSALVATHDADLLEQISASHLTLA